MTSEALEGCGPQTGDGGGARVRRRVKGGALRAKRDFNLRALSWVHQRWEDRNLGPRRRRDECGGTNPAGRTKYPWNGNLKPFFASELHKRAQNPTYLSTLVGLQVRDIQALPSGEDYRKTSCCLRPRSRKRMPFLFSPILKSVIGDIQYGYEPALAVSLLCLV